MAGFWVGDEWLKGVRVRGGLNLAGSFAALRNDGKCKDKCRSFGFAQDDSFGWGRRRAGTATEKNGDGDGLVVGGETID
jgi:hypothetical protein